MAKGNDIDLENISMKKWKCEKKRVNKRKTKIIMGGKHMEETNVTMTAEEMQGEPAAKENETKAEKFIRIGEYRMNKADDQRLHRHQRQHSK